MQEKFSDRQSNEAADHERNAAAPVNCGAQIDRADQLVDQSADHQQRDGDERRVDMDQDRAGDCGERKARET
jgi:hypothetical protein